MCIVRNLFKKSISITLFIWIALHDASAGVIHNADSDKHPVILIPGDAGSRAYSRHLKEPNKEPQLLWLNLKDFFDIDTITDLLSLRYDTETGLLSNNNEEYEITFPGWGDTETVATLDSKEKIFGQYFYTIIEDLKQDPFFVSNRSIRGAPYDFRLAPNQNEQFFVKLKQLVEETYALNGNRRVIIIGHSMGCLYSVAFLNKQTISWKKRYIKAFVSLAGPYGGAVKSLKVTASGENFGVFFRSPLVFRRLQQSFPSLQFMVPDLRLWPANEPIIITHNTTYSSRDYERFFNDIGYPIGFKFVQETKAAVDFFEGPTGVDEVYCVHGTGRETAQQLIYSAPGFLHKPFPDQVPRVFPGDGDGTVNLRSLRVCHHWANVSVLELPNSNHMYILRDPRTLRLIRQLVGFKRSSLASEESEN